MKKAERIEVKYAGSIPEDKIRKELKEDRILPTLEEEKEDWIDLPSGRVLITAIVPPDGRVTTPYTEIVIKGKEIDKKENPVKLDRDLIPGDEAREMIDLLLDKRLKGDMENLDVFPSVLLITGPTGIGKSQVLKKAKEIADENGCKTSYFTGDELCSKHIGKTSELFKQIKESLQDSNYVFILDEVEIVCSSKSKYSLNSRMIKGNASLNHLLRKLDRLNAVALLSSNHLKMIDPSIRNMSYEVAFKRPTQKQVSKSVEIWGERFGLKESDVQGLKQMEFTSYRESKKFCRLKALGVKKELDTDDKEVKGCSLYIR